MADPAPLEDAEFLVRSPNRVRVLRRLAEEPADRTALQEATDVSRVTLGRVLGDFEDREWVRRRDSLYHLTALGETVVGGLETFLESVEAAQRLRPVVEYLPAGELELPLERLHDATVTRPTEAEPAKYLRSLIPAADDADRIAALWSVFDPDMLRRHRNRAVDGDTSVTFVFGADIIETARPASPGSLVAELDRAPDGEVYEYGEPLPATVLLVDGTVFLLLVGDAGYQGLIESEDEVVREWADATIRDYRERSRRIDPESFAD